MLCMRSPEEAFAAYYAAMPDEELLRIAANRESLVPVARAVVAAELARRERRGLAVPAPKNDAPGDALAAEPANREGEPRRFGTKKRSARVGSVVAGDF